MAFQATFCIITVALVSGAVVERMRFGAFLIFATLWSVLVYGQVGRDFMEPGGIEHSDTGERGSEGHSGKNLDDRWRHRRASVLHPLCPTSRIGRYLRGCPTVATENATDSLHYPLRLCGF